MGDYGRRGDVVPLRLIRRASRNQLRREPLACQSVASCGHASRYTTVVKSGARDGVNDVQGWSLVQLRVNGIFTQSGIHRLRPIVLGGVAEKEMLS